MLIAGLTPLAGRKNMFTSRTSRALLRRGLGGSRWNHNPRPISTLLDAVAAGAPDAPALIAPQQEVAWSYSELRARARSLAFGLRSHGFGFERGQVLVSDLPNVAENLLLQLAVARLGGAVATAKDAKAVAALVGAGVDVRGVVVADGASSAILDAGDALALRPIIGDWGLSALIETSGGDGSDDDDAAGEGVGPDDALGYFGSATPLRHGEAAALGAAARARLALAADDRACVAITLCHAFGIGSAVCAALGAGAAVVLPAVGGIRGCGVPSQRAQVTREVVAAERCTLLFADSHTLGALPPGDGGDGGGAPPLSLRGGVVKIGSGSDFLDDVKETPIGGSPRALEYGGVPLIAMGKKK